MTRAQRSAARSGQRRKVEGGDLILALDRADLLRIVAEWARLTKRSPAQP